MEGVRTRARGRAGRHRPRAHWWLWPLVAAVVVGPWAYVWFAEPRDHSAQFRALPGVVDVQLLRWGPHSARSIEPDKVSYVVTLRDDPDAATLESVVAIDRRLRWGSVPQSFLVKWNSRGAARTLYVQHGAPMVTGAQLAAIPAAPSRVQVGVGRGEDGARGVSVQATCAPERLLRDCVTAFRASPWPVWAKEVEPSGALPGSLHVVSFAAADLDRVARLYALVRPAVPGAASLVVTGRDEVSLVDGRALTSDGRPRDSVDVQWGYTPDGRRPVAPALGERELAAAAQALASWPSPALLTAEVNRDQQATSWETDQCLRPRLPLDRVVAGALRAGRRPVLEPADCPRG